MCFFFFLGVRVGSSSVSMTHVPTWILKIFIDCDYAYAAFSMDVRMKVQ